jgi:hypothetical protein
LFAFKNVILLGIFSLCTHGVHATERDTILNAVYSDPYFYNVLADNKGSIFTGTSEGIFQLNGGKLIPYKKAQGYITLNKNYEPVITPEGIKNHHERKYLSLLPFPDLALDEYHASTTDHFYLCSGGRIYIYDIVPYSYSFGNHSIRSISENFVGTYSGIYYKGSRLRDPAPKFTDSYIREINGIAYMYYDYLYTINVALLQNDTSKGSQLGITRINHTGEAKFRDIYQINGNNNLYFSSVSGLLKTDREGVPFSIYKTSNKISEIVIIGERLSRLYFSDGNYLLSLGIGADDKVDTIIRLPAEILNGRVDDRNILLLTHEGLYKLSSDGELQKLTQLYQAHTMELISATEMVIATNNGLFRFNTVNRVLSPLIRGVEFNRKAMYKKGDLLQVGSINGLYSINVNDLELLASRNRYLTEKEQVPLHVIIGAISALAAIGLLAFLLFRSRRKLVIASAEIKELNIESLDRAKIEQYIRENLTTVSIKSITNHFDTNISHVYKLINPDKPGSIIQKLRIEKLVELKNAGKTVAEIAEATGLSTSYVVKIKNRSKLDD